MQLHSYVHNQQPQRIWRLQAIGWPEFSPPDFTRKAGSSLYAVERRVKTVYATSGSNTSSSVTSGVATSSHIWTHVRGEGVKADLGVLPEKGNWSWATMCVSFVCSWHRQQGWSVLQSVHWPILLCVCSRSICLYQTSRAMSLYGSISPGLTSRSILLSLMLDSSCTAMAR